MDSYSCDRPSLDDRRLYPSEPRRASFELEPFESDPLRSSSWSISDSRDPPRRPVEPDWLCEDESEYDPDSERPDEDSDSSSPLLFERREPPPLLLLLLLRLLVPRDPEPRVDPPAELEFPPRDDEPEFCDRPLSELELLDEPRDPDDCDPPDPPPEFEPPRPPDDPDDEPPEPEEDDEAFFAVSLPAFLPDFLAVFLEAFFFEDFFFRVAPPD